MPMPQQQVLEKLLGLVERLYAESSDFADHPEAQQLWYNRGYANGVIQALTALGFGAQVDQCLQRDAADVAAGHLIFAWGQAYRHGVELGEKETREVLAPINER